MSYRSRIPRNLLPQFNPNDDLWKRDIVRRGDTRLLEYWQFTGIHLSDFRHIAQEHPDAHIRTLRYLLGKCGGMPDLDERIWFIMTFDRMDVLMWVFAEYPDTKDEFYGEVLCQIAAIYGAFTLLGHIIEVQRHRGESKNRLVDAMVDVSRRNNINIDLLLEILNEHWPVENIVLT